MGKGKKEKSERHIHHKFVQNTTKKYKIFTEIKTAIPQAWKPLIQEAKLNEVAGHARKDFRVSFAKILMTTQ